MTVENNKRNKRRLIGRANWTTVIDWGRSSEREREGELCACARSGLGLGQWRRPGGSTDQSAAAAQALERRKQLNFPVGWIRALLANWTLVHFVAMIRYLNIEKLN